MSVLIKGMDMPETCIKCPMQFGGWCYVSPPEIDERVAPTVDEAVEQGKPDWCPLVEVKTPHGRLIDATPLERATAKKKDYRNDNTILIPVGAVWSAPTVIEAEE